ncbi:FAD:protein FMN transferase [Agrobacterium vitis]|uniref:FAD:protein FMN transferase n=1 Tax=Rhizobium/Agrobacterium group TaxID=227290 RepID=UPI0008731531|nr:MULTISPECIES: FAD:protein FMN transferase [Rhizobium/Agrobacterium group]MCF1449329.1 FAD:protein FMN transferase [Allorhizobium ampelinum]MCF1464159.1 FAD:protein FMN transferase [Allorhizobium ampelinum]MCF1484832.1 FAD:protein FMN transferase [Allorhizobium ampelinum]MUO71960.1 FAD:protein FMN transferase [Agrobacterium vitis]
MAEAMHRRRAICIMAAAAGLPLLGLAGTARATVQPVVWTGQALGAPATLILNIEDRDKAARLIRRVVVEVSRLEDVFSLYRSHSALSELNRAGALAAPPTDLVALLETSRTFHETSDGLFDPTIQPLFTLYARHFSAGQADPAGPPAPQLQATLARVGFDSVLFNRDRVAFARPGMALTLNGIAQGYITDRIVALLRNEGMSSSLVNMGEDRAIGAKPDGSGWRIGLAQSGTSTALDSVVTVIDRAVATSSAAGFHFDAPGRFGHILHPRLGSIPERFMRMTVVASDAVTADGLSTAFSLMTVDEIGDHASSMPDIAVDLVAVGGAATRFGEIL